MSAMPEGVAGESKPLQAAQEAAVEVHEVAVDVHEATRANAYLSTKQNATAKAAVEENERGPPPYSKGIFALRLLVPQCWLALWVVFLWMACYTPEHAEIKWMGEAVQVTVGPSCVMPPPPPPATAIDRACDIEAKPAGPHGPQIRTTSSVDYREALAPDKAKDASYGSAPVRFHWEIFANTRNATCKENVAAGTVGKVRPCEYKYKNGATCDPPDYKPDKKGDCFSPECSVHFFAGELFLAFGMLSADTSRMEITLVEGWDACMPHEEDEDVAPPGHHPLDALVAHMFKEAGRPGSGFLGREEWPATELEAIGTASKVGEGSFIVADLANPTTKPKMYEPSTSIYMLAVLFVLAIVAVLFAGYIGFWKWHARQTGAWKQWVQLFYPRSELGALGLETLQRKRAAAVARHLRSEILQQHLLQKQPEGNKHAASGSGTDGKKQIDFSRFSEIHSATVDFLSTSFLRPLFDGEDIYEAGRTNSLHVIVSLEKGHPELLKKRGVKFPVDGWHLPGHRGANKPLKMEEFCRCLLPKVRAAAAARRIRRDEEYNEEADVDGCCGHCHRCCNGEAAFSKHLCEDIFRMIDHDHNQTLSIDEIYNYILYYTKDTNNDAVKTEHETDSDTEDDDDGEWHSMPKENEQALAASDMFSADKSDMFSAENEQALAARDMFKADEAEEKDERSAGVFLLEQSSIDRLGQRPVSMDLLADMIFGGPAKVTKKPLLVVVVGSIQGALVFATLLLPIVMIWQRQASENPYADYYPVEKLPILGNVKHTKNAVFVMGLVVILFASINNVVYVILGWEMRCHNSAQARRVAKYQRKETERRTEALLGELSKSKANQLREESKQAELNVDRALPEPPLLKILWTIKGVTAGLWTAALGLSAFFTLALIIDLVVVIIVAATVDPFRPLAVLSVVLTVLFYIINAIEGFRRIRNKFSESIKQQYLAKHADELMTKQEKKKVLAKLRELIDEELEALGLTFGGIAIAICVGLVCVSLVLGMVLIAQHLFYANRGGGPGEFVATVLPCIGIVVGRIKSTTNQSRSIEQQVKNLEKTAAAVGKGARDGVRVTHQVVMPREGSPEFLALQRAQKRKAKLKHNKQAQSLAQNENEAANKDEPTTRPEREPQQAHRSGTPPLVAKRQSQ